MKPLRPVVCRLVMEPRCIVAHLEHTNGAFITTVQGTTYGEASMRADAVAFAMGLDIKEWK